MVHFCKYGTIHIFRKHIFRIFAWFFGHSPPYVSMFLVLIINKNWYFLTPLQVLWMVPRIKHYYSICKQSSQNKLKLKLNSSLWQIIVYNLFFQNWVLSENDNFFTQNAHDCRAVVRFPNPGVLPVMWWAQSAPSGWNRVKRTPKFRH